MAHIFKLPENGNKGIIVFTHKEIAFFQKFFKQTRFDWANKLQSRFVKRYTLKRYFKGELEQLRKDFFIGMHFGHFHKDYPKLPYVDFYMGSEGTVLFKEPVFRIPLNSRNFIPTIFQDLGFERKYWDIICVAKANVLKKMDEQLKAFRRIYDLGHKYRILLLVPPSVTRDPKKVYVDLEDDYYRMFNKDERDLFTLMSLRDNLSFLGLPQTTLVEFYNNAKVFTLYSQREGESRVISEALLCGLPVVVKDNLIGGGRDFLNESNSVMFKTYEASHEALIHAVEHYKDLKPDTADLIESTREDASLKKLNGYFEQLYRQHGQHFDGKLINQDSLDFRLPGHYLDLEWGRGRLLSADILSNKQYKTFLEVLNRLRREG